MENNNTNEVAITFGKLVENMVPGVQLVNNSTTPVSYGIWSGKSLTFNGTQYGYYFNTDSRKVVSTSWDTITNWAISEHADGSPMCVDSLTTSLVEAAAEERMDYIRANKRADVMETDLRKFKSNVQETLHDWAESSGLDQDENSLREFNEMMEGLGLEGLKREFTVTVRVTYDVEITVEATSEENASYEVDNNLSDYIYDQIDVSYYDDYEITNISES